MEFKELSKEFLKSLELKIIDILNSLTDYKGSNETDLFLKDLCEEIQKFELVSGEIAKYTNSNRIMIEYDVQPKKVKGLVYRNLLPILEKELGSMLNSRVTLFEH